MKRYRVNYIHTIEQETEAFVFATSEEEAREKVYNGEVDEEEIVNETGLDISIDEVEEY